MATSIYVNDSTKDLLERVAATEDRTQDGEINYLLKLRAKELGIDPDAVDPRSVKGDNLTNSGATSQGKSKDVA